MGLLDWIRRNKQNTPINVALNSRDAAQFLFTFYYLTEKFSSTPALRDFENHTELMQEIQDLWALAKSDVASLEGLVKEEFNSISVQLNQSTSRPYVVIEFEEPISAGNCKFVIVPFERFYRRDVIWNADRSEHVDSGVVICAHNKDGHAVHSRVNSSELVEIIDTVNQLMNEKDYGNGVASIAQGHLTAIARLNHDVRKIRTHLEFQR